MIRTIVIVSCIILTNCSNSGSTEVTSVEHKDSMTQHKVELRDYYFEANDKSLSVRNFHVKRELVNDSIFIEYGLICSNDTDKVCSLKFSYNKEHWGIWDGDVWHVFYDNQNKNINTIELKYTHKTIKQEKNITIDGNIFLSFSCRENNVDFTTDDNSFGFSPKYGIVIMKNAMTYYMRSDFALNAK